MKDLREKIFEDLKKALREKKTLELSVLRMLQASLKNKEIEKKGNLTESDIIEVINKEIKRRRQSAEEYKKVNREDAAEKELKEAEILMRYMPEQLSEEEIREEVKRCIEALNASDIKDLGKVMKEIMPKLKGKADGKVVSKIIKEELEK